MFNGQVEFGQLPESQVEDVQPSDTTPSVLNKTRLAFSNTGSVTVTDFLEGQEGQQILVLGDGFTTLDHGSLIVTNTGADKLLSANQVYSFTRFNSKWVESATSGASFTYPARRVQFTTTGLQHTHVSAGNFEVFGVGIITIADLTNMTQIRVTAYISYSAAGSLKLQYSTNGSTWVDVTGGQITYNSGSGQLYTTAYGTLNVAARIATCYLRIQSSQSTGGDTVTLASFCAECIP